MTVRDLLSKLLPHLGGKKGKAEMKIKKKLYMDMNDLSSEGAITIVAFGDSVTHGCFGHGEVAPSKTYHRILAERLEAIRPDIPVNVINAGISGDRASSALARMDSQVLAHRPDLVIVAFGLNDVNGELEEYISSLREIFSRAKASGADVIFMTPNMLNTYVRDDVPENFREYSKVTAEYQNGGRMDLYMSEACRAARGSGVAVADCYGKWKALAEGGADTTAMLANGINHPTKEMHGLFADTLLGIITE